MKFLSEPQRADYPDTEAYFTALEQWAEEMKGLPLGPVEEQERPYSDPDHPFYDWMAKKAEERRR